MLNLIECTSHIIAWVIVILACGFGISLILTAFYILGKHLMVNIWGVASLTRYYAQLIKEREK